TLDGGMIGRGTPGSEVDPQHPWVFDGDITLTANGGTLGPTGRIWYSATYNGDIIGAAGTKMTVNSLTGGYPAPVVANFANASFMGDWDVVDGVLVVNQDGALGVGTGQTVTVSAPYRNNNWGGLEINVPQTVMPTIVVEQGKLLARIDLDADVTMAGGLFQLDQSARTMSGVLDVTDDSAFLNADDHAGLKLTLSGTVTGGGKLTLRSGVRGVELQNDGSGHSGGWDVLGGFLNVNAPGALGTGSVYVGAGGALKTMADASLDGTASVLIDTDGKLELASTETSMFEVQAGGALVVTGGSTVLDFDYANGGNVKLHKGAVIDASVTPPDPGLLAEGDGVFGVWLSVTDTDVTVGNGDGGPYRGMAATSNLTYTSVATETTNGTLGLKVLAQAAKRLDFDGATLVPEPGNSISLEGAGTFRILWSFNDFQGPIEMNGTGRLEISEADSFISSTVKQLDVNSGAVHMGQYATGSFDGVTVTINDGGTFQTHQPVWPNQKLVPTAGNLTVKKGGILAIDKTSLPNLLTAGANWTIEEGAVVRMTEGYGRVSWPFTVPVVLWANSGNTDWYTYFQDNDVLVTEESFVSMCRDTNANRTPTVGTDGGNMFEVPATADGGRFSVESGQRMQVRGDLDFTGKTLIIGNPAVVATPDGDRRSLAVHNVVHDGTVSFDKYNDKLNVHGIGKIDIQAGKLVLGMPA
ncbi:MAG: hypothetical protein ACYS5V_15750, partial [Planctomycetota bacterium]